MLNPDYLTRVADDVIALYEKLNTSIINDISRRISKVGELTDTADLQTQRLIESGGVFENALNEISKITGKSKSLIEDIFKESTAKSMSVDNLIYKAAGLNPIPLSQSPAMLQTLLAGMNKTNGVLQNLTRTTAATAQQAFIQASDLAYMQITSGAFDYNTAIRNAVKSVSATGLTTIDYASGHSDRIDVAVRRAVLTGVNQTAGKLTDTQCDEMDCDLVETSAHAGARPEHQLWQGKTFSRSGKSKRYPDFVKSTGYGDGAGLCGWGCRHSFYPFFEGLSESAYPNLEDYNYPDVTYNGKKMSYYDATQEQRRLERNIRRWKREASALESAGFDNTKELLKVREWSARADDFASHTGLSRQREREQIQGFGHSLSSRAVHLEKQSLIKSLNGAKLKEININHIPITDEAISKVPAVKGKILSEEKYIALQEKHKSLLRFVKDEPEWTEAIAYYDMNINELAKYRGSLPGSVSGKNINVPHIVIHNHPSGNTFSLKDISNFMLNENANIMTVVGNNGNVYLVEKNINFNFTGIYNQYQTLSKKTPDYESDPNKYIAFMEIFLKGAGKYGLRYQKGKK